MENETINTIQNLITSQARYLAFVMEHKKSDSDDCIVKEAKEHLIVDQFFLVIYINVLFFMAII